MRIKTFTAPTSMEAMALAAEALGDDAIIISTETIENNHIRITAAIDDTEEFGFDENDDLKIQEKAGSYSDVLLRESLEYHGVLDLVKDRILSKVRSLSIKRDIIDDKKLLKLCFEQMFNYSNILDLKNPLKLFMGTPGSGKSTAIAKTATQAKMQGLTSCIISTDNVRAGANKQLEAFADILGLDFYFCKSEKNLFDLIQKAKNTYQLILIDTAGINPFIKEEVDKVSMISEIVGGEGILVLPAGLNTYEAAEIADVFSGIGATHLLPTRLDLTRRIGAILTVAECCELNLSSASVSSSIAAGLAEINSSSLTKLVFGDV